MSNTVGALQHICNTQWGAVEDFRLSSQAAATLDPLQSGPSKEAITAVAITRRWRSQSRRNRRRGRCAGGGRRFASGCTPSWLQHIWTHPLRTGKRLGEGVRVLQWGTTWTRPECYIAVLHRDARHGPVGDTRNRPRPLLSIRRDHEPFARKQDGRGPRKEWQVCHYADLSSSQAWCSRSPL
jgi:hypothetical protein